MAPAERIGLHATRVVREREPCALVDVTQRRGARRGRVVLVVRRDVQAEVVGASGIREDLSVMDTTMVEVPINGGMIAASRRTVLLVDAAKFEMTGSVRVCGAGELDVVVTDAGADHPGVVALEREGVEVVRG